MNFVMPFAATWINLETVILSEVSQTEEEIPCDIAYMWNLKNRYKWTCLQNRSRVTDVENKHITYQEIRKRGKLGDWDWYICTAAAAAAKSLQSCPTLCDPTDGSPPGSPIPGILQARTLERVAISFSNAWKGKGKVDCSLLDSSVHGIFQARVLEWGAGAFSYICTTIYKIDT